MRVLTLAALVCLAVCGACEAGPQVVTVPSHAEDAAVSAGNAGEVTVGISARVGAAGMAAPLVAALPTLHAQLSLCAAACRVLAPVVCRGRRRRE